MNAGSLLPDGITIALWQPAAEPAAVERELDDLAELLRIAVLEGAGVSFFVPFGAEDARLFWTGSVLPAVQEGSRRVLIARQGSRVVGTVQLDLALPPNQAHRADVAKMLVHPDVRGRGVARALMTSLENVARSEGRTLLLLDTVTGSRAEALYTSLGYVTLGVVPRFARKSLSPELEDATFMYKELDGHERD